MFSYEVKYFWLKAKSVFLFLTVSLNTCRAFFLLFDSGWVLGRPSHFVPVYLLTPYLVGQCTFDVLDTILNYLRKFFINICYTYPTKLFVELLKKKKNIWYTVSSKLPSNNPPKLFVDYFSLFWYPLYPLTSIA